MLIILFQLSVSVVYALLPNRIAITCTCMYLFIYLVFYLPQQNNKKLDPQLIITDFEPAMEKANRLEVYFSSTLSTVFD